MKCTNSYRSPCKSESNQRCIGHVLPPYEMCTLLGELDISSPSDLYDTLEDRKGLVTRRHA